MDSMFTIYRADVDGGYQHIIAARSTEEAEALALQHDEPESDVVVTIKEIINIEGIPVRVDEDGLRTVTLARLLATDPPRHPCIIASTCEE
jgi:hypothetical protein